MSTLVLLWPKTHSQVQQPQWCILWSTPCLIPTSTVGRTEISRGLLEYFLKICKMAIVLWLRMCSWLQDSLPQIQSWILSSIGRSRNLFLLCYYWSICFSVFMHLYAIQIHNSPCGNFFYDNQSSAFIFSGFHLWFRNTWKLPFIT